jgi:hypothetical protein
LHSENFPDAQFANPKLLAASRDVDGHAIRIGKLEFAVLALGEPLKPDLVFGPLGFWAQTHGFLLIKS